MQLLLASSVANVEFAVLLVGKSLGPERNVWGGGIMLRVHRNDIQKPCDCFCQRMIILLLGNAHFWLQPIKKRSVRVEPLLGCYAVTCFTKHLASLDPHRDPFRKDSSLCRAISCTYRNGCE